MLTERTLVIISGGDGTIFGLVNLLLGLVAHPLLLHLVPMGTGNDLFFSLKPKYDIRPLVRETDCRKFDLGRVTYNNGGKVREVYFTSQVGLGFSVEVAKGADKYRRLGVFKYKMSTYMNLAQNRGIDVILEVDGHQIRGNVKLLQIQNCALVGGGISMAPLAQVDDGLLDVVVACTDQKLAFIKVARKTGNGMHIF
jgi:diacylglycerol kinase (ATP)